MKKIQNEEPVPFCIQNSSQIENTYRKSQKVVLKCVKCGKEVITRLKVAIKNEGLCRTCKTKKTNLERYGTENINALQSKKEKTKETCKKRYGVENPFQTEKVKEISREWASSKEFSEKLKESWKTKTKEDIAKRYEKSKQTNLKKRGIENPFLDKEKIKAAVKEKYGVENVSQLDEVKKKSKQTCLERYGIENPFLDKEKIKAAVYEKYGMFHAPSFKFLYEGLSFDSKWELALWIYAKDHNEEIEREPCCFEYEYNGVIHTYVPDFRYKGELIEIKGSQFVKEDETWQNPFDHSQDDLFEAKHQCVLKNGVEIFGEKDVQKFLDYVNEKYTKDFLGLFRKNLGFPFPVLKGKDDMSLIRFFHKSIFEASKKNKLSPLQAWQDKDLIKKSALNRLKYVGRCEPQDILKGFSIAQIAPKVSVFRSTLAKNLIEKYLGNVDLIIDPFSGFSGRMLGAFNSGKKYIGFDVNEKHVKESNEIIAYKSIQGFCKVEVQDLTTFEKTDWQNQNAALFTCPPYEDKEHWNEDEIEKSCDEWIDLCLKKHKGCKRYLFVVDETEKYKDKIVETLANKSHFGTNFEYVILL